jgi:hypothetical protein
MNFIATLNETWVIFMNDKYFREQAERYDPAKPSPWHFMRVVLTAIFALGALVPTTSSAQDVVCKSGKVCPKGTVCLEGGMCAEEDQNFSCAAGFRWTGVLCTKTSKECTPKQCPRGESCETDICTEKSCDRTRGHCYAANEIQTCKAGRCPAQAQCAEDGCAWIKGSPTAQKARGNKDSPGQR